MLLCASLVSTSFEVCAAITNHLDPLILTFCRFVLAALILTPYLLWRYGLRFSFSLLMRAATISCCLVLFFWSMFSALRYTSPLNISVLFTLVPSISGIYAYLLRQDKLQPSLLIALACGVVGTVWVIFEGDLARFMALDWNRGDLIFLCGCAMMGFYTPLVKMLHRGEPMLVLTYWVLVTGAIWLTAFGANRIMEASWLEIPVGVWSGLAYLAFFTTVVTFFLTQYCTLFIGPTRTMAYSYLYPLLVICLELAMGHGLPSVQVLPGVMVVLVAMVVMQRSAGLKQTKN